MQNKSCSLISTLLIFFTLIINPAIFAGSKTKKRIIINTRESVQENFFEFAEELFKWTAYFSSLRKFENEPIGEIYFRIDKEKVDKVTQLFSSHRETLYYLSLYPDLNLIEEIEIIPQELYDVIRERFALTSPRSSLDYNEIFLKIIGGDFSFAKDKQASIKGLLEYIDEFDMNSWLPVKKFIHDFKDTLSLDSRLSQTIGRTLLPIVKYYYTYMDTISRLRIFKEVISDVKLMDINGKRRNDDLDQLATKIFQNSGPVMIKLLQQLQEEVVGESAMTTVLESLKESKPMSISKAEKFAKNEIKRITGLSKLRDFKFRREPLGIASIAQTHLISFKRKEYVVKIQKDKIEDIYIRERDFLKKMVAHEPSFDKGMKQKIRNTDEGIREEIDFNFERDNINKAKSAYRDSEKNIHTVSNPKKLNLISGRGNPEVLIMSLASGEPLGKIMKRGDAEEIQAAYLGIQNMYEQFLLSALDPRRMHNFYHGDLHRENIFFNIKTNRVTPIDYGNAGELSPFMRQSILEVLSFAKMTDEKEEEKQETAIINLANSLQNFVLQYNNENSQSSELSNGFIKVYFKACFNPQTTVGEKLNEKGDLQVKKHLLERDVRVLELQYEQNKQESTRRKIESAQDDIDFIKALSSNCLNGPYNPLLRALSSDLLISDKLNIIFQELLKNGIAMPKEVIFFNKSKSLLEGILTNLSQTLEDEGADFTYVEPDEIYSKVIEQIYSKSEEAS